MAEIKMMPIGMIRKMGSQLKWAASTVARLRAITSPELRFISTRRRSCRNSDVANSIQRATSRVTISCRVKRIIAVTARARAVPITMRPARLFFNDTTEAALSFSKVRNGVKEVIASEVRPEGSGEVEFGITELPEKIVGDAMLTTCSY